MSRLRLVLVPPPTDHSDDEVPVRVRLVNDGDEPVEVVTRLAVGPPGGPGELTFLVVDPEGERLPFGARVNLGRPTADDVTALAPGDSASVQVDLLDYFDLGQPGTYRISATYRYERADDDREMPEAVWTGTAESEEVRVQRP